MQTDAIVDPAIPPSPVLLAATRQQHRPLHMIAIALLLCCLLKTLSPDIAHQIVATAQISSGRNVAILLLAWVLSVIWHELGHLMAAVAVGFDITGMALGPLRATRLERTWSLQFSAQRFFSASISAVPNRSAAFDTVRWRHGMLLIVAGGPLATLVAAVASIAFLRLAVLSPADACFCAFCAELNALIFVLGLLPNRPDSLVRNDASLFLAMMRGGSDAHAILLYHLITQVRRQGFRPCFYPEHIIRAMARAHAAPEFRAFFAARICEWALDRGRNATAEAWDSYAMSVAPACSVRTYNQALAQSACVDILIRHDWKAAATKCAEIPLDSIAPEWLRHRSKAVGFLARRNILDAMGELQRAEFYFTSGSPYFEFEKHLVNWLRHTAKVLRDTDIPLLVES